MYVKNRMTIDPYCISGQTTISEALTIMKTNGFHRLPVVENGVLIGLITEGVIRANAPSQATSLSIHELNYLLSKTTVTSIMISDVVTVNADALLEKAATIMREHSVGCLPVVEGNKVVGIITQNDIFDAFVDLLGYYREGYRFVITVTQDKPGTLEKISKCFFEANANIFNMAAYYRDNEVDVVVIANEIEPSVLCNQLEQEGFKVLATLNKHN